MKDILKQHRTIGILHVLKGFKEVGLVEKKIFRPKDAIENVQDEIQEIAQTWYEIGAKRGGKEVLNAFLDGKFGVKQNSEGDLEIFAEADIESVSWNKRLVVSVGNDERIIKKRKYQLTLEDLEFNTNMP